MTDVALGSVEAVIGLQPEDTVSFRRMRSIVHNRLGMAAIIFLFAEVVVAVFAPLLAPYDPIHQNLLTLFSGPSWQHLLGNDDLGRDVLSRLIYGARVSLEVGVLSVGVSLLIAVPIGFIAGYRGGIIDRGVLILVDILLSVPPLILVFAIEGILGPSVTNLIIALAVFFVPTFMRLTRQETRHLRQSQLVEAERALGLDEWTIAYRHVLPAITPALIVQAASSIGVAIISEAALSFLGLGVRPPAPSWGVMLQTSFPYITTHPWLLLPPSAAVLLTVLAFNVFADALRDALGRDSR